MSIKLKNFLRKAISITICLSMILPYILELSTIEVQAASVTTKTINGVKYTISDVSSGTPKLTITGKGTITDEWQDQLYTTSGDNKYYYYGAIGTIVINSDNITSIGYKAFGPRSTALPAADSGHGDCTTMRDLRTVQISNYNDGTWDSSVFVEHSTITKLIIGKNIDTLSSGTFKNCSALTTVEIKWTDVNATNTRVIPESIFEGCNNLGAVSGLNSKCLTTIKKNAFKNCGLQYDLTLGKNITVIEESAFENCKGIGNIYLGTETDDPLDDTDDSSLTTIGKDAFKGCKNLANFTVSTRKIGMLPNTLTSIGDGAFLGCVKLSKLRFNTADVSQYPTIGNNAIESVTMIVGYGATEEATTTAKTWAETNNHFNYIWAGKEYSYTKNDGDSNGYKLFEAEFDGIYLFELYGAKGGGSSFTSYDVNYNRTETHSGTGANGGKTKGAIELKIGDQLHIYLGGKGGKPTAGTNGGGSGYSNSIGINYNSVNYSSSVSTGGGGGAVDIRTVKSSYDTTTKVWKDANGNTLDYDPRILVAGGGAGAGASPYFNAQVASQYSNNFHGGHCIATATNHVANTNPFKGSTANYKKDSDNKITYQHETTNGSDILRYPISGGGGGGYYGGSTSYDGGQNYYAYQGGNYATSSSFTLTNKSGTTTSRNILTDSVQKSNGNGSRGDGIIDITVDMLEHITVNYNSNHSSCNNVKDEVYPMWYDKEILNTSDTITAIEAPTQLDEFVPTHCEKNHQLVGWNTKADGTGKSYKPGDTIDKSLFGTGQEITLYAQWEVFSVEYYANGSTIDDYNKTNMKADNYVSLPYTIRDAFPSTDDYDVKWNTKSDGTGKNYSLGTKWDGTTDVTVEDGINKLKLYAQYTRKYYTYFHSNHSTYVEGYRDYTVTRKKPCWYSANTSVLMPGTSTDWNEEFNLKGYKFIGWALTPDGEVEYSPDYTGYITVKGGEYLHLYAQYEPINIVSYYANNAGYELKYKDKRIENEFGSVIHPLTQGGTAFKDTYKNDVLINTYKSKNETHTIQTGKAISNIVPTIEVTKVQHTYNPITGEIIGSTANDVLINGFSYTNLYTQLQYNLDVSNTNYLSELKEAFNKLILEDELYPYLLTNNSGLYTGIDLSTVDFTGTKYSILSDIQNIDIGLHRTNSKDDDTSDLYRGETIIPRSIQNNNSDDQDMYKTVNTYNYEIYINEYNNTEEIPLYTFTAEQRVKLRHILDDESNKIIIDINGGIFSSKEITVEINNEDILDTDNDGKYDYFNWHNYEKLAILPTEFKVIYMDKYEYEIVYFYDNMWSTAAEFSVKEVETSPESVIIKGARTSELASLIEIIHNQQYTNYSITDWLTLNNIDFSHKDYTDVNYNARVIGKQDVETLYTITSKVTQVNQNGNSTDEYTTDDTRHYKLYLGGSNLLIGTIDIYTVTVETTDNTTRRIWSWRTKPDTESTSADIVVFGEEYSKNEDITLYGQWAATPSVWYNANYPDEDSEYLIELDESGTELSRTKRSFEYRVYEKYKYSHMVWDIDYINKKGESNIEDWVEFGAEGYLFKSWNTKADGSGTSYSPDDTIANVTQDIVLFAQWEPITYTVNLYKNTPTDATNTIEAPDTKDWEDFTEYFSRLFYHGKTSVPNTTFYTLVGWHTENIWYKTQGENGKASGDEVLGGAKNLTKTPDDIINLYPNWIKNEYTIVYDGNDTEVNIYRDTVTTKYKGDTPSTSCQYDTNVKLAYCKFTKEGYQFKEWNTQSDGSGNSYSQGQLLIKPNFTAEDGGSITLYAIWEPIRYTIKFNGNHNFNNQATYTQTIRFDQEIELLPNLFNRETPYTWGNVELNQDYEYIGWGKTPNQVTADWEDKEKVLNLSNIPKVINMFALWQKDLTLTFDLNGGKYKGSTDNIVLSSTIYNSTNSYTFNLKNNQTAEDLPNYTIQTNTIDAYGTYDNNGVNGIYTMVNSDGTYYRFLGWSTNKYATEPDTEFIVYNPDRIEQYKIYDSTTLYAVWEPVLTVYYQVKRTLGAEDEEIVGTVVADASKSEYKVYLVAKPGEQCDYSMIMAGPDEAKASVTFDQKITNIYDNNGTWTDTLNPNPTNNDDLRVDGIPKSQKHGLNRTIQLLNKFKQSRKFYIPLYLGTEDSEPTSIGVTNYTINNEFTASSFYSRYVLNSDEKIVITTNVIIANSDGELITVLDELRTKLKIRIKDINS